MSKPTGLLAPHNAEDWSLRDAAHFLWRTQFGATAAEIKAAHDAGLTKALDSLITPQEESENFKEVEAILREAAFDTGATKDLQVWWLHRIFYSANPLAEKLTLFWHNHFATSNAKVRSIPHMAAQNDLFRTEALGSFRHLLKAMAKDVAMLIWLDSNANRKRHANENFAREVMELFSLGEGNYTEEDIKQAARAFTGWHVREDKFWFNKRQHDFMDKTLFGKTANLDGGDVVDLCLEQKACARFIAFKILRAFVLDQPSSTSVDVLAARITEHDYAMSPVMHELLSSKLFFSETARHARIKSPLELTLGTARALEIRPNLQAINNTCRQLGQALFEPPTVKGWEGGRLWISSATLLQRNNFAHDLLAGKMGKIETPKKSKDYYQELLLAREVPALQDNNIKPPKQVHLMMTLPEFQLT